MFMLKGYKYSVPTHMHICGYISDKCCTIYDEFKMFKLWHERTKPIMFTHIDLSLYTLSRVL